MVNKQNKARTFEGMKYRQIQRKNSRNKKLFPNEKQILLKEQGYRNIGWNNVINLFKKIKEIQQEEYIKSLDLEELFLEADRIGNKYLDSKEIDRRNAVIAKELNQIVNIIDKQFPDNAVEVIDYSKTSTKRKL